MRISLLVMCGLMIVFSGYCQNEEMFQYLLEGSSFSMPSGIDFSMLRNFSSKNMADRSRRLQSSPHFLGNFDTQVDEDEYILSSGDGITVYLWGSVNDEFTTRVNYEGNVMLPSVGMVNVNGLSLRKGKEKIKVALLTYYKDVEMTIILSEIRQFKIYILGDVENPGPYKVNGATRVSDILFLADGGKILNTKDSLDTVGYTIPRNIRIENENRPTKYADLAVFYNYNVIDKNPYLTEGDRIFVPQRSQSGCAGIYGAVHYPGKYNVMHRDTLINILKAAGGLAYTADSSKIVLTRFANNKDSLVTMTFSFHDSTVYKTPVLKDDRILVCRIPDYREHRQVAIRGEVKYPGIYPIQKDKTRLLDIITSAGGLTEDAFLKGSKIVRKSMQYKKDREFDRVKHLPPNSLSPLERSYLKTKIVEEEGMVSANFQELIENKKNVYNIILRDGDEITISRKDLTVKVTGAVIAPGLISYKEDKDYKYYINQAGGFNTRAKKYSVMIIKGGTERWLKPGKVKNIEAGDTIWIPEKQYQNKLQIVKDILMILGSTAAVVVSIMTITE